MYIIGYFEFGIDDALGWGYGYYNFNLNSWDVAAGSLIVKEAGGFVGNINKSENYLYTGNIYACNNNLIDELENKLLV